MNKFYLVTEALPVYNHDTNFGNVNVIVYADNTYQRCKYSQQSGFHSFRGPCIRDNIIAWAYDDLAPLEFVDGQIYLTWKDIKHSLNKISKIDRNPLMPPNTTKTQSENLVIKKYYMISFEYTDKTGTTYRRTHAINISPAQYIFDLVDEGIVPYLTCVLEISKEDYHSSIRH